MATFIIAEAGVNHNGSLAMALEMVDAAAYAGVDAVKFQTFSAKLLVSSVAPKAAYQKRTTGENESQLEMLQNLELDAGDHDAIITRCKERGLTFLATPFDDASLELLSRGFGLETIKVSSGDLTNAPFLLQIGRKAKRIILSTGMSTLAEIEAALGVLAFALTTDTEKIPDRDDFFEAYISNKGQIALREAVTLLHCTTDYPAPFAQVNLRAMNTMSAAFGLPVGYSDHTEGIHVPVAAVARGAKIIEKHFTLDKTLPGPDHRASLELGELSAMVKAIRDIEAALGDGIKRPSVEEMKNRVAARKSLVSAALVAAGQPMKLTVKRPGNGVSPYRYWALQGCEAPRDYQADELVDDIG